MSYETNVFINCPFGDQQSEARLRAMVFAIHYCGFVARSALEEEDGSDVRVDKIFRMIRGCKYGIHDISFAGLDPKSKLARFNMPLELGFFLGAKEYGSDKQKQKSILVLDSEKHRFQKFCSDISGQDIQSHDNDINTVIKKIRSWLRNQNKDSRIPGPSYIQKAYKEFDANLLAFAHELKFDSPYDELNFNDYTTIVSQYLELSV